MSYGTRGPQHVADVHTVSMLSSRLPRKLCAHASPSCNHPLRAHPCARYDIREAGSSIPENQPRAVHHVRRDVVKDGCPRAEDIDFERYLPDVWPPGGTAEAGGGSEAGGEAGREASRARHGKALGAFASDTARLVYELPATLSSNERGVVHELAGELKLHHASTGDGDARHICVWKDGHGGPADVDARPGAGAGAAGGRSPRGGRSPKAGRGGGKSPKAERGGGRPPKMERAPKGASASSKGSDRYQAFKRFLAERDEDNIAVVCHHNVIIMLLDNALSGVKNAMPILCSLVANDDDGTFALKPSA